MEHKAFNAAFKEQLLNLIEANGSNPISYKVTIPKQGGSVFTVEGLGMGASLLFPAVETQLKNVKIANVKIEQDILHVAVPANEQSLRRIGQAVQAAKDAPATKMREKLRARLTHTLDAMTKIAEGLVGPDNAPAEVDSAVRDVLASRGMDTGEAPGFAARVAGTAPSSIVALATRERAPGGASRGSAGRG